MQGTLDTAQVEQELGIKLPVFFVEFYRDNTELIKQLKDLANDEDYIIISTDTDWIIEVNRDYFKLPKIEGKLSNKLCIGGDGCGNYYFISLSGNDKRVFFLDHEIAGDLIDETTDDFKWESDEMDKYDSIEQLVKEIILIYRQLP